MSLHDVSQERFSTTVTYEDFPAFAQRAHILRRPNDSIWGELWQAWAVVREAPRVRALLLDSTSGRIHPDLLAAILIGFLPRRRRPVVVFMGAMWQKDPGLRGLVQRFILRRADRVICRYALQSSDELPLFSAAWGIPMSKLRFVPYFYTFTDQDLETPNPPPGNFIFAGGNAHRDYGTFVEAARALPEYEFVIASRLLEGRTLPPNVRAAEVPRDEFIRLMRASVAVVVPLRRDLIRASGQQTYLNAMLLGKPTIVTDTPGVSDYIHNDDIAWVVDGSAQSYVDAIREIFAPDHREQTLRRTREARQRVRESFSFDRHAERLVDVLDEAIRGAANE
ncbi:MAG TPA: glycosyltransferase family 4 protein [Anaerolineales bacterium]